MHGMGRASYGPRPGVRHALRVERRTASAPARVRRRRKQRLDARSNSGLVSFHFIYDWVNAWTPSAALRRRC
jgi:hypothetical protein